ncbi:branched-chain-amino-acid aminotransferase-like protein 1 [Magnolia sinica]|uniref:branched-chain-amino-acid aminotransferase-like protein 1 n=1 Tax=Magnolia sinica TaxID=86752 RepID=UPI00265B5ECF|nr:branched-chain-amino-acid aminotransferase-like protein 1 [Magnolia sinica]
MDRFSSNRFDHLIAAFLAMEPAHCLISLAQESGGGSITNEVQSFLWEHCISKLVVNSNAASHLYIKNFIKKVIVAVESSGHDLLDVFYEQYAYYMASFKDDNLLKGNTRVYKSISFLFPDGHSENQSCPRPAKVVIPLKCSVNMLEGDTGCSIWPSSLFLSEFILSYPEIFSDKFCFEVGSGVGLVGISLTYVNASKVILSDGDLSSLANLKHNLELNQSRTGTEVSESTLQDVNLVETKYLKWESASVADLQDCNPDIVLGADVMYDPLCVPHLIRVLTILLARKEYKPHRWMENCCNGTLRNGHINDENNYGDGGSLNFNRSRTCEHTPKNNNNVYKFDSHRCKTCRCNGLNKKHNDSSRGYCTSSGEASCYDASVCKSAYDGSKDGGPIAYIATVIRNPDTFDCFLRLTTQAGLSVVDITEMWKPLNLLPYMISYDRSSIRLLSVRFIWRGFEGCSLAQKREKMGEEKEIEVIHSWSAPRSLSTSLMYSFAQRDDMEVLDEPLYAHFLRVTGVARPYREEVLSKMDSDGNKVVKEVIFGPGTKRYRYCKHMSKQYIPGLNSDLMKKGKHFILIRNPLDILPSFDKVVPPSFLELGLASLVAIYSELCELGTPPPVIDAADLQDDPETALRGLCEDLGIPFQASMLKWEAGPKPVDGVWAPWWYKSVHKSTCFTPKSGYPLTFPSQLYDLLEQSLPFYNMLRHHSRRTSSLLRSPLPPPSLPVPENEKLIAWVGDELMPRESAKVSVFDSVVQGGDAVWEGLRVYNGKVFKLDEHLDRLFDSAKALAFNNVPSREEVKEAIFSTLITNGMFDNAHIRLTLTRGKKVTSGMSPAFNLYGCTLIVLAEWKPPVYDNTGGITLVTATTRRNSPNNLDSKIHHNNLLNNILAKVEGNLAKADDAIMLDQDGYVSETNATNIFLVKKGHVLTPHADYCLPGITRATVMDLVVKENLVLVERRISLSEFHTADEVWTTGTMGELTPVVMIDGRVIGDGKVGPVTRRVQNAYKVLTAESGEPIPIYSKA